MFKSSFRGELRDSYIHSTTDPNPGGAGYGIAVDSYSADCLVENNISWNFNKVMVMRASGGGNVIAYNYMQDGWGAGYPTLPEVGTNAAHSATSQHELFEGNESHNMSSDTTWGNTIYVTALRNHMTGLRTAHGPAGAVVAAFSGMSDQGNRRMVDASDGDRWFSFIGNVLGCSATKTCANAGDTACLCAQLSPVMPGGATGQTSWQYDPVTDSDSQVNVWQFLYMAAANAQAGEAPQDCESPTTCPNSDKATILRWGELRLAGAPRPDVGRARLDGDGQQLFAVSHRNPGSFYLTSKPTFFGSNPWPWVDPTTGTTYVLPARARFDSGKPNTLPQGG